MIKRISQGTIHAVSVAQGSIQAARADMAHVDYPFVPRLSVIRPDAELLHRWTADEMLVADLGKTLSAYSTKAKTLVTGASLSPTIPMDFAHYNYFVAMRGLGIPKYNTETKQTGRCEYCASAYLYEVVQIPSGETVAVDGSKALGQSVAVQAASIGREVYWTSATAMAAATNVTYGTYVVSQTPAISGTTLTVKAPNYGITGNTKQMTSAAWSHITDIRYQYVVEAYRAPKGKGQDGWGLTSSILHLLSCVRDQDGALD